MKAKKSVHLCRCCLINITKNQMKSIYIRDEKKLLIAKKIEHCGGIKIKKGDGLPTNICSRCNEILGIAYKFRSICKNSDNFFRKLQDSKSLNNLTCSSLDEEDDIEEFLDNNDEENNRDYCIADEDTDYDAPIDDFKPEKIYFENDDLQIKSREQNEIEQNINENSEVKDHNDIDGDIIDDFLLSGLGYEIDIENESKRLELDENSTSVLEETFQPVKKKPGRPRKYDGTTTTGQQNNVKVKKEVKSGKTVDKNDDDDKTGSSRQVHICEICGNIYERKYCLEAHMRRHRGEKPFECEICKKSFALNFQLTRHMRSHTGQKPYKCKYCDRRFADRSTNVKHERIHTNERPYQCDTCGKSFTYSNVLKIHKMTHTGEKPFICKLCGKGFSQLHHLRAHMQIQLHRNDPRAKDLLLHSDSEEKDDIEIKEEFLEDSLIII